MSTASVINGEVKPSSTSSSNSSPNLGGHSSHKEKTKKVGQDSKPFSSIWILLLKIWFLYLIELLKALSMSIDNFIVSLDKNVQAFCGNSVKVIFFGNLSTYWFNDTLKLILDDLAQTYLQPHYGNGVLGNVYLSAGQH